LAIVRVEAAAGSLGAVITDHIMPQVSGVEFVRLVRQVDENVPIIVLSGLAEAQEEYRGLNVAFRQKPCPLVELISLVQRSFDEAA
jgi:DNA-binding response OmpR family regulator